MKIIFFNQRELILCKEKEMAGNDPEAVIIIDNGTESLKEAVNTIENNANIRRLYVICKDTEESYGRIRSMFREIDAAGGLIDNGNRQYLLILRNGIWDLPKGKREKGEDIKETAAREVMEECGIPSPEVNELICITDHTYRLEGQPILKHTYWYAMQTGQNVNTTPQTEEGITGIAWVPAERINEYAELTYPSIKEVFRKAGLI